MSFSNLRSFIQCLEKKGDLHRIQVEVDPILEITEIATRIVKRDGPAILFERVKGSSFPAVINLFGSHRRIEWALGRAPQAVGEELVQFSDLFFNPSLAKIWQARFSVSRLMAFKPRRVSSAPFIQNQILPVGLEKLPIAQSWPEDGGRFFTFPLVITRDPGCNSPTGGRHNVGVYRMQVFNGNQTGMHWQIGKGGGYHYLQAEKMGQPLNVAVAVGADPVLMLCGILPLPEGLDEMAFAGFLRGQSTRVTSLGQSDLSVPAEAEFILEGVVPPQERKIEGPYGDHFGHYSHAAEFPVFHVRNIYHRSKPIFPLAVVGQPPQEDNIIGAAVQDILLPLIKLMHPEIIDLWAYPAAGFHNLIVARVRQRFKKEAIKTALWILGEGQLALSKCVIVVDENVDARNFDEVLKALTKHFNPEEDFILLPGTSQDTLDFTSFKMNLGSKMILDATRGEVENKPSLTIKQIDAASLAQLDNRIKGARMWGESLLALQVVGEGRSVVEKVVKSTLVSGVPVIAAVSPDVSLENDLLLLWGIFTRFDCHRDTIFADVSLQGGHPKYSGPLGIDATWKPGYPKPLTMSADIVAKVDSRWKEYGFKN